MIVLDVCGVVVNRPTYIVRFVLQYFGDKFRLSDWCIEDQSIGALKTNTLTSNKVQLYLMYIYLLKYSLPLNGHYILLFGLYLEFNFLHAQFYASLCHGFNRYASLCAKCVY
jgi:hypothetical protein